MKLFIKKDLKHGELTPIDQSICCFGRYRKLKDDGGFYFCIRLPLVAQTTIRDAYTGDYVTGFYNPIFMLGRILQTVFPNRYEYKWKHQFVLAGTDEFYRESSYGKP